MDVRSCREQGPPAEAEYSHQSRLITAASEKAALDNVRPASRGARCRWRGSHAGGVEGRDSSGRLRNPSTAVDLKKLLCQETDLAGPALYMGILQTLECPFHDKTGRSWG